MKIIDKINSLNEFLSKAQFDKLDPVLDMINQMPKDIINNINLEISNYPKKIEKTMVRGENYYINFDDKKLEICKTSTQNHINASAIEKIAIYKKSNFYNPSILTYTLISDNRYDVVKFEIESLNQDNVKLQITANTKCPALNKQQENALTNADFVFETQKMFESKYCGYKFGGNIYCSQPITKAFTCTHEKFNKLVCQLADIIFEK